MNEVIREFLIETHENLAQLDLDLVTLEKDPTERETLARVFRTMHTVKGTAGFLGLERLQAVAHAAENLLSRLRDGKLVFNAIIASALLKVVDAVRQMLEHVEASETDGEGDFSSLIQTLERFAPTQAATRHPWPFPPRRPGRAKKAARSLPFLRTSRRTVISAEPLVPEVAEARRLRGVRQLHPSGCGPPR